MVDMYGQCLDTMADTGACTSTDTVNIAVADTVTQAVVN